MANDFSQTLRHTIDLGIPGGRTTMGSAIGGGVRMGVGVVAIRVY